MRNLPEQTSGIITLDKSSRSQTPAPQANVASTAPTAPTERVPGICNIFTNILRI